MIGVVVAILVLAVEGVDGFAFWNLSPVVATSAIAVLADRSATFASHRFRIAVAVFCFGVLTSAALLHLAWQFDWEKAATGSSTSGLIFIFAPLYEVAIGVVLALLAVGVQHGASRLR